MGFLEHWLGTLLVAAILGLIGHYLRAREKQHRQQTKAANLGQTA